MLKLFEPLPLRGLLAELGGLVVPLVLDALGAAGGQVMKCFHRFFSGVSSEKGRRVAGAKWLKHTAERSPPHASFEPGAGEKKC
jgi:hypothetical protein